MEMKPVKSSQIEAIGYNEKTRELYIKFIPKGNNTVGKTYCYEPITQECYNELMQAESKGNYFHEHIKNNDRVSFKKVE